MKRAFIACVLTLVACGRQTDAPVSGGSTGGAVAGATARGEVTSASADTATGTTMDHSNMPGMAGMASIDTPTTKKPAMAGMDHSKMPGMSGSKAATSSSMAGMNHSAMAGMAKPKSAAAAGGMAGMNHTNMPGMTKTKTTQPSRDMPGMSHANMTGMTATKTAADAKVDQLVAALLRDSVVRRRIRSDSALQRGWDAAAQQFLLPAPPQ